ncbi:MAG: hypothetical protein JSS28_06290 [Proteobacteria bacterium]|nr:hypothetical protein [Pseudomonadota bacterium]
MRTRTGAKRAADFVEDVLRRVQRVTGINKDDLAKIEVEVRGYWGGERPYIAKTGSRSRACITARDAAIRDAHKRDVPVAHLALRHSLSERMIRMILSKVEP